MKRNKKVRVIMVDDDADDIFLTKVSFKRAALDVDFAGFSSGRALFDHIKYHGVGSIDIILLDLNMPVQNGHEVLKNLKQYQHISEVRIIMCSTSRLGGEFEMAMEFGADDFIVKPSSLSEARDFAVRVMQGNSDDAAVIAA